MNKPNFMHRAGRALALAGALALAAVMPAPANADGHEMMSNDMTYPYFLTESLYASVSGIWVVGPQDTSFAATDPEVMPAFDDISYSGGGGFTAAIGFGEPAAPRIEFEIGRRSVGGDTGTFQTQVDDGNTPATGRDRAITSADINTWSFMLNGYLSGEMGRPFGVKVNPYVGAGIGVLQHEAKIPGFDYIHDGDADFNTHRRSTFEASDTVIGYQLMAGLGLQVSDNAEIRLGWRYFTGGDFDGTYTDQALEAGEVNDGALAVNRETTGDPIETSFSTSHASHDLEIGLIYYF